RPVRTVMEAVELDVRKVEDLPGPRGEGRLAGTGRPRHEDAAGTHGEWNRGIEEAHHRSFAGSPPTILLRRILRSGIRAVARTTGRCSVPALRTTARRAPR